MFVPQGLRWKVRVTLEVHVSQNYYLYKYLEIHMTSLYVEVNFLRAPHILCTRVTFTCMLSFRPSVLSEVPKCPWFYNKLS